MRHNHLKRRGIVLLVVLSLLTLFAILGVTFLLVAGQYKTAAVSNSRIDRYTTSPEKQLHAAALQVLRDSGTRSVLQTHGLLTDIYGNDGVRGVVVAAGHDTTVGTATGSEFLFIRAVKDTNQPFNQTFSDQPDYYAGRVITFLTGSGTNISTRVVDYTPYKGVDGVWGTSNGGSNSDGNDNNNTYDSDGMGTMLPAINERAERFWTGSDDYVELRCELLSGRGTGAIVPGVGSIFLINGQPFNGTGHGYNPTTSNIDLLSTLPGTDGIFGNSDDVLYAAALPAALLPNQMVQNTSISSIAGGADEDYDTFGYQNMFLAMVPPDLTNVPEIIPSYHRPALINYWFNWAVTNLTGSFSSLTRSQQWLAFSNPALLSGSDQSTVVSILRAISLRPLSVDHPNFAVNNPDFHLLGNRSGDILGDGSAGSWDVDNDGDGIPDSIWIDVGLPLQTAPDGRRFRPLVAILCQDLDGRLNLNAHDKDPSVVTATTFGGRYNLNQVSDAYAGTTYNAMTGKNSSVLLPRALGTGGVDVCLGPLFHESSGDYAKVVAARYRGAGSTAPGFQSSDDPLSAVKFHHMPSNYATQVSSYLSPPDLNGVMAVGLDHYGQPLLQAIAGANANVDDPYEMFLGSHFGEVSSYSDTPFTVSEFERLLRYNDKEASRLPSRLLRLAQNSFANRGNRQRATVLSSYVPVSGSAMYSDVRGAVPGNTILDLYFQRLLNYLPSGPPQPREDQARARMASLLPFELLHGQRFDLNRAFGNGVDDTPAGQYGYGVVDEPAESGKAWHTSKNVPAAFKLANFNGRNDDPVSSNPRFNYARHLYCLTLMMMGPSYQLPAHSGETTSPPTASQKIKNARQRVAQWAVNVVDFRDSDAIMTAFEYDTNPFNGWNIDGDPRTDDGNDGVDNDGDTQVDEADEQERGLLWGCESPELLITETFAMHDRRVKDTIWDDGRGGEPEPAQRARRIGNPPPRGAKRDRSLDQFRIPQGSLFFELQSVRGKHLQRQLELYDPTGNLDLARMSPNRTIGGRAVRTPVWRVAISAATDTTNDGQTGVAGGKASSETYQPTSIDRIVWFTNVDPATANNPDAARIFFNRTTTTKLAPNGYLVVGPRATTAFGALIDTDIDPATHKDSPQSWNIDTTTGTFSAQNSRGNNITPTANIRTPAGMVCAAHAPTTWTNAGRQIGLSVSEPLPQSGNYYQEPNRANDGRDPPDAYADLGEPIVVDPADPLYNALPDRPFDDRPGMPLGGNVKTGTRRGHTSCFLQRLADPTRVWNPLPSRPNHDPNLPLNPYITVDWSSVDLTVYTGEEDTNEEIPPLTPGPPRPPGPPTPPPGRPPRPPGPPFPPPNRPMGWEWLDPTDEDPYSAAEPREHVRTRQRDGGRSTFNVNQSNIWSPSTLEPQGFRRRLNADAFFPFELNAYTSGPPAVQGMTLGYLNWPFGNPKTPQPGYQGAPSSPFPWMAWNNRPFTSPYELLMVPASSPGRLLLEYSAPRVASNYFTQVQASPFKGTGFGPVNTPCAHMLNFLHSSDVSVSSGSTNFHRLLDFVEVPSPYLGAEKWYNPANFSSGAGGATFRPPFNKLSRFRDPGRVNVNTIIPERSWSPGSDGRWGKRLVDDDSNGTVDDASEAGWPDSDDVPEARVWEGIAKNFPELDSGRHRGPRVHPGKDGRWGRASVDDNSDSATDDIREAEWTGSDDFTRVFSERLFLSRQGYGTKSKEFLAFDASYPSRFSNPFRSAANADLMPLASLRKRGVDATFLRSDIAPHFDRGKDGFWGASGDDNGDGVPNDILEAGYPGSDDVERTEPLFVPDTSVASWLNSAYRGQDRNPYFRYQALQHIGNVLSTTSNTFAVWLTVGYFEVEDNPGGVDVVHPDGLRLGQEVGLDTGEVKRHRAFYIIDRSIPVAYEPGQNHNVEKAILLRRYIE